MVFIHKEDLKKIKAYIEYKRKNSKPFDINAPINKVIHQRYSKKMGDTLLHYACYKGNKEIIRYFEEELKANPKIKNEANKKN